MSSSYKLLNKDSRKEMEIEIIKGKTYIKSEIENTIDSFLEDLDLDDEIFQKLLFLIKEEKEMQKKNKESLRNSNGHNLAFFRSNNQKQKLSSEEKEVEIDKIKNDNEEEKKKTEKEDSNVINSSTSKSNATKLRNLKMEKEIVYILTKNNTFSNYLTKTFLIKYIIKKFFNFCFDNFHFIVYFFMVLNHIRNNSIISVFWPLAVFGYALIEYPRPKNVFWRITLFYSLMVTFFKFSISFIYNFVSLSNEEFNISGNNVTNSTSLFYVKIYLI